MKPEAVSAGTNETSSVNSRPVNPRNASPAHRVEAHGHPPSASSMTGIPLTEETRGTNPCKRALSSVAVMPEKARFRGRFGPTRGQSVVISGDRQRPSVRAAATQAAHGDPPIRRCRNAGPSVSPTRRATTVGRMSQRRAGGRAVAGSNPVSPIAIVLHSAISALVVGARGVQFRSKLWTPDGPLWIFGWRCRAKSNQRPHGFLPGASLVAAPGCGPGGRGFESRRSPFVPTGGVAVGQHEFLQSRAMSPSQSV